MRTEVRGQRSRLRRATARQAEVGGREAENAQRSTQTLACPAVASRRLALVLMLVLLLLFGQATYAQQITLKTGQKIDTLRVRRDADMVMGKIQVGTGSGEVGYHASQIAKIDFPEPRGLKVASDLMTQGQPEKALGEIEPIVAYYEPFKEVPGAWWAQAALLKVSVLAALRRDAEAETLASEIQKAVTDPETARAAQLRVAAGLIRKRDFEKAVTICDAAIKQSTDPEVLANAWVNKGDALLGQKQWDVALQAYLHVPVFYADESSFMPAALLGSARAYWRLDDTVRAKRSFNDLIAAYPKSAEAVVAQSEMKKMQVP
jgi:tetratricopeptide (TPR) repeat protein